VARRAGPAPGRLFCVLARAADRADACRIGLPDVKTVPV